MFYTTNRCNALCKHCKIWAQNPKIDLDPSVVETIINAECTKSRFYPVNYGLEGGEFLLHPKYKEILELVKDRRYILLSNGVLDDLLIDTVREFDVKHLHISLDGGKETHAYIRGVDIFDKIDHIIDELNSQTNITLVYTATPWNNYTDYQFVKRYCNMKGTRFALSIFADFNLFNVGDFFKTQVNVLKDYDLKGETDPYLLCYQGWLKGKAKIPCQSTVNRIVVYPNGDIPFCCNKQIVLGNIYQESLDEIWRSQNTRKIQNQFLRSCNDCWISYHRNYDLYYIDLIRRGFPGFIAKRLIGEFSYECAE